MENQQSPEVHLEQKDVSNHDLEAFGILDKAMIKEKYSAAQIKRAEESMVDIGVITDKAVYFKVVYKTKRKNPPADWIPDEHIHNITWNKEGRDKVHMPNIKDTLSCDCMFCTMHIMNPTKFCANKLAIVKWLCEKNFPLCVDKDGFHCEDVWGKIKRGILVL